MKKINRFIKKIKHSLMRWREVNRVLKVVDGAVSLGVMKNQFYGLLSNILVAEGLGNEGETRTQIINLEQMNKQLIFYTIIKDIKSEEKEEAETVEAETKFAKVNSQR